MVVGDVDMHGTVRDIFHFLEREPHLFADVVCGSEGQIVYDLRADFGTTPEELRKAFDFYFEKFAVREEVK